MFKKFDDLKNVSILSTGVISKNKNSIPLNYSIKNNLNNLKELLEYFESSGDRFFQNNELPGIIDLLKYKYLNIISNDYLLLLDSKFLCNNDYKNLENRRLLKLLGFTGEERYSILSCLKYDDELKDATVIDLVSKFIKRGKVYCYIGEYLSNMLLYKMKLIYDYYFERKNIKLEERFLLETIKENLVDLNKNKNKISLLRESMVNLKKFYESTGELYKLADSRFDKIYEDFLDIEKNIDEIINDNILILKKERDNDIAK